MHHEGQEYQEVHPVKSEEHSEYQEHEQEHIQLEPVDYKQTRSKPHSSTTNKWVAFFRSSKEPYF